MRYTMLLMLLATTAQAESDWFDQWQVEQNTERRHQEMLQQMERMSQPQESSVIILPAPPVRELTAEEKIAAMCRQRPKYCADFVETFKDLYKDHPP